MSDIEWPDREPVSADVLAEERRHALRFNLEVVHYPDPVPPGTAIREVEFTCDGCGHAPSCALAFDLYNTDGDCLASK